jgi:hypothetical protein
MTTHLRPFRTDDQSPRKTILKWIWWMGSLSKNGIGLPYTTTKNFSHSYNLSQPEQNWEMNWWEVEEISDLTTCKQTWKTGNPILRNRENKNKIQEIVWTTARVPHIQRPSRAMCMILTNYNQIPTDFLSSWQLVFGSLSKETLTSTLDNLAHSYWLKA